MGGVPVTPDARGRGEEETREARNTETRQFSEFSAVKGIFYGFFF